MMFYHFFLGFYLVSVVYILHHLCFVIRTEKNPMPKITSRAKLDLNLLNCVPILKHIALIAIVVAVIVGIGSYFIYDKITDKIQSVVEYQQNSAQYLMSNLDYKTERQRMVMFSRDFIMKINPKITLDEAYHIAQSNVKWCEVYPSQDPLLKLALQWKESTFRRNVVSHMGAIGINQVMPYMAQILCRGLGINYNDSMLYNVDFNNRISSQLFEENLKRYKKVEVALACYNGGPWSAYYYSTGNEKLNEETKAYVPEVMDKYQSLKEKFSHYHLDMNQLLPDTSIITRR